MSETSGRRVKKRTNVFAQVIANAEDVVQSSFIASGPSREVNEAATVSATFTPAPAPTEPREADQPAVALQIVEPPAEVPASEATPARVPPPARKSEPSTLPPRAEMDAGTSPPASVGNTSQATETTDLEPSPPSEVDRSRTRPSGKASETVRPTAAQTPAATRRLAPAAGRGSQPLAHQAVWESFASATISSKTWTLHGFRIVPEVLAILKTRMNADRRSTGNQKLAISHYLDAALRQAPTEVEQQIALAQEFLTARMGMVEAGRQSTYRVGQQASALVSDMNVGLQEADYGRKGIYVVSASIESFLAAMDAAGELKRPEMPGDR